MMFGTSKLNPFACLVLLAFGQLTYTQDFNPSDYCVLVPNNFNLADVAECSIYYTCVNNAAVQKSCPAGEYYNKNTQQCTTSSSVCSQNNDPCKGTTGEKFVSQPGNCQGYIYCKDGEYGGSGVCPNNMNFVDGKCTYASCPSTGSEQLSSLCQIFPVGVYFGSFEDCQAYQKCSVGNEQPTIGYCNKTNDYVYDAKIQKCNRVSDGMCDGRGTAPPSGGPTGACNPEVDTTPKPDTKVCSVYYVCDATTKTWTLNNCNGGEYFNLIDNKCASRQTALPSPGCDRCEGTSDTFVNAVDPECRDYLYCVDSQKNAENECAADRYFDEQRGGCVSAGGESETEYVSANGACTPCTCEEIDTTCKDKYGRTGCDCTDKCQTCECEVIDNDCKDPNNTGCNCTDKCQTCACDDNTCPGPTNCICPTDCPAGTRTGGV